MAPHTASGLSLLALRAAAVAIAIAAIIDPSVVRDQPVRPDVVVMASDPAGAPLLARVRTTLAEQFTVLDAPFGNAAAVVVVGLSPMREPPGAGVPLFAVLPTRGSEDVIITAVRHAGRVSIDAPAVIETEIDVPQRARDRGAGDSIVVTLQDGATRLDRIALPMPAGAARMTVPLTFVATRTGIATLQVTARVPAVGTSVTNSSNAANAANAANTSNATNSTSVSKASTTTIDATADDRPGTLGAVHFTVPVDERRGAVLVYDARPSWMSTFVRRALERDPRVVVTSRVVTSRVAAGRVATGRVAMAPVAMGNAIANSSAPDRSISTDVGRPPAALSNAGSLSGYDVIVVGAPDALTGREVDGLERFLADRGGSVVLLMDNGTSGPYQRLLGVSGTSGLTSWTSHSTREPVALIETALSSPVESPMQAEGISSVSAAVSTPTRTPVPAPIPALRAAEWTAPRALPPGASVLVSAARARAINQPVASGGEAIVWTRTIGIGTLVVSGALDAWRYRDSTQSRFSPFWRDAVAGLADAAIAPLTVSASPSIVHPGDRVTLRATVRDLWQPGRDDRPTAFSATLSQADPAADSRSAVRLWPSGPPGSVVGQTRAPAAPGRYRISVAASGGGVDSLRGEAEFVVADSAQPVGRPLVPSIPLMTAMAQSRGGAAVPEAALSSLRERIGATLGPRMRRAPWYPMRSAWWLVPFGALLATEWWLRRRRGLA